MSSSNFFKGKKILVTGGAGFVGTNLLLKLLTLEAKVRVTIHKKNLQINNKNLEVLKVDLTNSKDCKKAVEGMDLVFMCAANTSGATAIESTPLVHVTPNVIMNSLMLEAAHRAGVKKFLFLSSNTVYPLTNYPVKESDVNYTFYDKYFPVGWMKLFTEKMCEMYSTKIKNPMQTIIIRPGNIYGPYDNFDLKSSHVVPALIRKVIERQNPLEVWGDGKDLKDFIYSEDLAEGLILAIEKIEKFETINIGGGKSISINEILKIILKIDGYKNAKIEFKKDKPTMIPKRLINISKAKKILGFVPKTPFKKGLEETIKWYRESR